ncbi:MAG: TonB-dependent receptor [Pirellulales bacterium]|nr:TonB-dependent receptor [Pirellulales bacterium]
MPLGAAETPSAPTLWNYLGIPQGIQKVRDVTTNRRGNHPNIERPDALRRISDPANLAMDPDKYPEIVTAAKIKKQEDEAEQKIKAIKYLGTIGCAGCYEGVDQALLEALGDCTEAVRHEAAIVLCQSAGCVCDRCGGRGCCTAAVMKKLHELAYETDESCCHKEPSARVRAAARNALQACMRVTPASGPPGMTPIEEGGERIPSAAPTVAPGQGQSTSWSPYEPLSDSDERPGFMLASASVPADDDAAAQSLSEVSHGSDDAPFAPSAMNPRAGGSLFQTTAYQQGLGAQPILPGEFGTGPMDNPLVTSWGTAGTPTSGADDLFRSGQLVSLPGAGRVAAPEATGLGSPDLADVLRSASNVQSVEVQRRSPVSLDPNLRGFKAGQVYTVADGAYWTPARRDLDTMLSKIDPGMIQDVMVISGPYGLRYGPGFGFIDVVRAPTPRYKHGHESHLLSTGSVRTNGGQLYGRETLFGGSQNWGYRISYGHRRGNDYEAGSGLRIPSSYENRDVWGELSYDLNPYQRLDFAYQRLDQTDAEYACQMFDIRSLVTNGFQLRLVDEDPAAPWTRWATEAWYNRTRFGGDTSHKHNASFPTIERIEYALDAEVPGPPHTLSGVTDGSVGSSGLRTAMTFGDVEDRHATLGTDYRYLSQHISEVLKVEPAIGGQTYIPTSQPHSWLSDAGMFAEYFVPATPDGDVSLGARVDFIGSTARASDLRPNTQVTGGLDQNEILPAFYWMNRLALDSCWTFKAGFGHAQRPPTLTERYADGVFLGIAQTGYTRVIGDPDLRDERDWQIDLGLEAKHDRWRGRADVFHSWVDQYITWQDDTVVSFADARLLRFVNTDLATLAGFELSGEYDWSDYTTLFGTMRYVEGRDQTIDAPLPAIPPLDSRVGVRLHDPEGGRRWGLELGTRIVNTQNRLGTVLLLGSQKTTIEERTGGFAVWHLRGYYNHTKNLRFVAGIDNLFDRAYQEHLDLRLLGPTGYPHDPTRVLSPGFAPYFATEWTF